MPVNRIVVITIIIFFISGCIEPFDPDINGFQESIVISGMVTNQTGYHYVYISKTSPYDEAEKKVVEDCMVSISDNYDHIYNLEESSPGVYRCWIDSQYLEVGTRFRLYVKTVDGKTYLSDYDVIRPCPPVTRTYFEVKEQSTDDFFDYYGLQFYADIDASEDTTKNFLCKIREAWEYHVTYPIRDYYDEDGFHFLDMESEPEDSLFVCYSENLRSEFFVFSTSNLSSGIINRAKLHFVSNETERLKYRYIYVVDQYSISDEAYLYWKNIRRLSEETGGLYETQPQTIKGNIHNPDNPDELVLGYFMATSMQTTKTVVDQLLPFQVPDKFEGCSLAGYTMTELNQFLNGVSRSNYPIFLINLTNTGEGPWDYAPQECFNCRLLGGDTKPPSIWVPIY